MVTPASLSKRLKGLYESLRRSIKIEHKKVFEKILGDLTKGETVAVGSLKRKDTETMFDLKRDPSKLTKELWNCLKARLSCQRSLSSSTLQPDPAYFAGNFGRADRDVLRRQPIHWHA
jgi:hypothetical protein